MRLPPFLGLPTRVSRLYPVFAFLLLLSTGTLLFAWQQTQLNYHSLQNSVNVREASLKQQISNLTTDRTNYRQQVDQQTQTLEALSRQLDEIQKQLQQKTDLVTTQDQKLQAAQAQIKQQEAQLSKNASELEQLRQRPPLFSFQNQTGQTDISQQEADVKAVINSAYDSITQLYGKPYLLKSITITFVNSFSISGSSGEISMESGPQGIKIDIHLKSFDKNKFQDVNTLIHEIIHGFHGIAVFDSSALEEGITVAATDAVMQTMIKAGTLTDFKRNYISITDEQYDALNQVLTVRANNDQFYQDPQVSEVYQLIGKAWYRFYQVDPAFFQKFNDSYYPFIQRAKPADTALVLDRIRTVLSGVGEVSINDYLAHNRAFNPQ